MSSSSSCAVSQKHDPHPLGCKCLDCSLVVVPSESQSSLRAPMSKVLGVLRGQKGGFNSLKPIKVKLWGAPSNIISSAATALSINTVFTFNTSNFPELSSFAGIYDQARVMGVHWNFMPFFQTTSSSLNQQFFESAYAIEFDPSISGPSSVQMVLESTHHSGPFFVSCTSAGAGGAIGSIPSVQKFKRLSAKTPGPLAPIVASDCVGNAWFTLDVTAPIVCVINGYHLAAGTLGVTAVSYYMELDVEFRMRT